MLRKDIIEEWRIGFQKSFKDDVCTVFVQGLKNEIWSGIDEFIRKYDDFTLDDFTVRVVD